MLKISKHTFCKMIAFAVPDSNRNLDERDLIATHLDKTVVSLKFADKGKYLELTSALSSESVKLIFAVMFHSPRHCGLYYLSSGQESINKLSNVDLAVVICAFIKFNHSNGLYR